MARYLVMCVIGFLAFCLALLGCETSENGGTAAEDNDYHEGTVEGCNSEYNQVLAQCEEDW